MSSSLLLILGILFWSGNYVLGRAVVGTIPPLTLAYIRWALSFLIFLPFCWRELQDNYEKIKANWYYFVLFGATGLIGYNYFQYLAVKYTTAINATIINSSTPMLTALGAYFFLKSSLRKDQILGIALSFFGVLWIITRGNWEYLLGFSLNKGDLFMIGAILLNSVYLLTIKVKGTLIPPKSFYLCSVLGGLVSTFPAPLAELSRTGLEWLSLLNGYHFLSLLYFSIFPSILSMIFFNKAIVDLGPVKTAIYLNLSIIFSSILGGIFLAERLTLAHITGGCFIVLGVWLTNRPQPKAADETLAQRG